MNATIKVAKNDTVELTDGMRTKKFVVLGFSKFQVSLATVENFNHSMEHHGEYNRGAYGYTAWNLKSGPVQKGFWDLLSTVNGNSI